MTQEHIADAEQLIRTGRSGISRKLLQRKAAEKAVLTPATDVLEDSFPASATAVDAPAQAPQAGSSSPLAAALAPSTGHAALLVHRGRGDLSDPSGQAQGRRLPKAR